MAKSKKEKKEAKLEVKKETSKNKPKQIKEPLLKLIATSSEDDGTINGALVNSGYFIEFRKQVEAGEVELEFTQEEFDKMIIDFKNKRI